MPDGFDVCRMKHFNHDATSSPFLFSFGCKRKLGLNNLLSDFMSTVYNDYLMIGLMSLACPSLQGG